MLVPGEILLLPRRRPRVLALELIDAGGRAAALQATVVDGLARANLYTPEKRAFRPHLTLARSLGRGAAATVPTSLAASAPPPLGALTAETVTVYRSHLSPRGARYEPLARRRLRVEA